LPSPPTQMSLILPLAKEVFPNDFSLWKEI
jgi:hypothetical protein